MVLIILIYYRLKVGNFGIVVLFLVDFDIYLIIFRFVVLVLVSGLGSKFGEKIKFGVEFFGKFVNELLLVLFLFKELEVKVLVVCKFILIILIFVFGLLFVIYKKDG